MNKKSAEKMLKAKHNKFLASIKDDKVKAVINKDSIITGGAIASMLLNEKVNDYDYYFRNIDTVELVANYFVKQFIEEHPDQNIIPQVIRTDDRVKVLIKSVGLVSENETNPYQYFENSPEGEGIEFVEQSTQIIADADEIPAKELEDERDLSPDRKEKKPYRPVFMTSNAITLSDGIQLILRFIGDPKEIHKNYDFIHCTNYWLSNDQKIYLNQDALESLLSKHLKYIGSLYPVCSVIRTRKFIKRGWHINAGQYIKMLFQISQLDLTNIEVLEDQLIGVDNAYFHQIIEFFKKKKEEDNKFEIDQTYLISIIDKIF